MMKKTLLAAILATAAIAFSCTVEEPVKSDSMVFNPTATVTDFVLDGATKTAFTINDNNVTFAFEDDDILRIYPLNPVGDGLRFTVKDNKGTSCVFDGGGFGLYEGLSYAAFYPGSDEIVPDATEIPVDYTGQSMMAKEAWDLSAVDYLVATIPAVEGACSFSMKHIGALMVLDVTFEEAGTYNELTLTSDGTPFITAGTIDLTADPIAVTGTEFAETVTLALGGADGISVEAGETVRFVMMIAPVDMSNSTITMTLTNGDDVITAEIEGKNYQPGKAFKVLGSPVDLGDPTDLSANETANSYIVSEPGYYSIDATIAGNGKAVPWERVAFVNHAYPEYDATSGTVKGFTGNGVAVVLNQNGCVSNVSYKDGKILFKATGNEGNAKLTLTNSGVKVWTWHIWCTDTPAVLTYYLEDADLEYHIMDRNMGAISDGSDSATCEELSGLYYQYGNPIGYTFEDFYNQGYQGYEFNGRGLATQQYSLALNPNKPTLNVTPGTGKDYYWFDLWLEGVPDKLVYSKLWGGGSDIDGSLKWGDEVVKTLYDPCPAGYKIMGWDTFDALSGSDTFSGNSKGLFVPADDGDIFLPYNGAAWPDDEDGTPFYMARGPYRELEGAAVRSTLWLSGHIGRNMAYYNSFAAKSASSGVFEPSPSTGHIVARGFGVRCMADEFEY